MYKHTHDPSDKPQSRFGVRRRGAKQARTRDFASQTAGHRKPERRPPQARTRSGELGGALGKLWGELESSGGALKSFGDLCGAPGSSGGALGSSGELWKALGELWGALGELWGALGSSGWLGWPLIRQNASQRKPERGPP